MTKPVKRETLEEIIMQVGLMRKLKSAAQAYFMSESEWDETIDYNRAIDDVIRLLRNKLHD